MNKQRNFHYDDGKIRITFRNRKSTIICEFNLEVTPKRLFRGNSHYFFSQISDDIDYLTFHDFEMNSQPFENDVRAT